jgi:hypothetical protein
VQRNLNSKLNQQASYKSLAKVSSKATFDSTTEVDVKRTSSLQFTESDKRAVMNKFFRNKEIMFLIFGLMFPYKTLMNQHKKEVDVVEATKLTRIPEEI